MRRFTWGGVRLTLLDGDITGVSVDAVVNAANERMLGGGGVDGAIHRAAGPELLEACKQVPEVSPGVRCPTGEARITPGFDLPARHVIHTVGPQYQSDEASAPLLASAYRSSLELGREHGCVTIAFPAVSCGVYGYPPPKAARIALETVREHGEGYHRITFALYGGPMYAIWEDAAERLNLPVM